MKIVYDEQFKYKRTKREDQRKYEEEVSKDVSKEYEVVVRAANPKRKVSTFVKAEHSYAFQKQLVTLMQSQMFKDIKAAAAA
jgi:hypothetical protein